MSGGMRISASMPQSHHHVCNSTRQLTCFVRTAPVPLSASSHKVHALGIFTGLSPDPDVMYMLAGVPSGLISISGDIRLCLHNGGLHEQHAELKCQ